MKSIFLRNLLLIILPAILLIGCDESSTINDNTIHGSGRIVSQFRTVDECTGINVKALGNLYLTQDTIQSVRIEADDNVIDDVISRKEGEILTVGFDEGSYSDITLNIYVSIKNINSLSINGAGKIITQQPIDCDELTCFINGAGSINLKGSGNYLNCGINGAGDINTRELIVEKCKAVVNGAGSCTVYASEEIDASINGTGSIIYYGNPGNIKTSILGTGQITGR
ncbi:MAG TPA: head GIN domain-containing protein [Ignavibacteriaceae bacterium]|nr:head GIN domain-containing protein [Ignavibacteriaceae bacterium]